MHFQQNIKYFSCNLIKCIFIVKDNDYNNKSLELTLELVKLYFLVIYFNTKI